MVIYSNFIPIASLLLNSFDLIEGFYEKEICIILQVHGRAISIPGKALAPMIDILKTSLSDESAQNLKSFHKLVVESLRNESSEMPTEIDSLRLGVLNLCRQENVSAR